MSIKYLSYLYKKSIQKFKNNKKKLIYTIEVK